MSQMKIGEGLKADLLAVLQQNGGIPTALYEGLGELLPQKTVNALVNGKIPEKLPAEVVELILADSKPAAAAGPTVTRQNFNSCVKDLIKDLGLEDRVMFGETGRTREIGGAYKMSPLPTPGGIFTIVVDGKPTSTRLDLGHWNIGFRSDADAAEGYKRVETALRQVA